MDSGQPLQTGHIRVQSGLQPGDVRGQRRSRRRRGFHRRPGYCANNSWRPVTPAGDPEYPDKRTSRREAKGRSRGHRRQAVPTRAPGPGSERVALVHGPGRAPKPSSCGHSVACGRRTPSFISPPKENSTLERTAGAWDQTSWVGTDAPSVHP